MLIPRSAVMMGSSRKTKKLCPRLPMELTTNRSKFSFSSARACLHRGCGGWVVGWLGGWVVGRLGGWVVGEGKSGWWQAGGASQCRGARRHQACR